MPDDIKKINLETANVPAKETPLLKPKKKLPLKAFLIPLVFILVLVGAIGVMLLPLRGVVAQGQIVANSARGLSTAVKGQDLDASKVALADTRVQLEKLRSEYKKVLPLKLVPFLGAYIADGEHGINAAFAGLDAGDNAFAALEPHADLLGLKGESTFVSGTADDRIQTAVKTMTALTPKVHDIAGNIDTLRKELAAINPKRYPERIGKTEIRGPMESAFAVIDEAANLFVNAQPLIVNFPKLLGEPDERRYLVLFFNDKELRASGGFVTAYAQFRIDSGKMILEKADDIYALDASLKQKFPAPREITTFHKGVYQLYIRDSNLSPDFKHSMDQFLEMYNTSSSKETIHGIWAVDTHVLVEALRILGPMNVYGREFSAENDERCDCPRAVYELEDYSTRPVNYVRTDRKDIIGVLLQQIMQKALGVSPSQYWGNLFQMLIAEINQKHVQAYFLDDESQKAAESFNLGGRIMTASETATLLKYKENDGWDYLHINNSNMAGAKSNMFVSDEVLKDTTVNSDGTITTKLTVEYNNPYPGSDCGLESGGLCLNAPLRNWVRIYTPLGSKLVESKGSISPDDENAKPMDTYESLGKTVFEGFLIVNPLGSARLDVTYTSPVKSPDGEYRLLLQKQAGTEGSEYILRLNGKDRQKFPLLSDTEITL